MDRRIRTSRRLTVAIVLTLATGGGQRLPVAAIAGGAAPRSLACPAGGRIIGAGTPLQTVIDAAAPGAVLCLSPGDYRGPLAIQTSIVLQGPEDAVLHSDGEGTTVRVLAPRAELRGFTIDGSGDRPDRADAAVYVRADAAAVRGLTIRHALFGLIAEQSHGVTFEGNRVIGNAAVSEGLRGDGIRFWEVRGGSIVNNRLEDSRDLAVWYSPGSLIAGNTVVRSRFGTHFMYASDSIVRDNTFSGNVVGVFVMYSRNIAILGNTLSDHVAPDSMGLGVKESGDIIVERNLFVHDGQCVYFDTSPFREGDVMIVRSNTIARCRAGVTFHKSEVRTTFEANRFEANGTPAMVEGRGTARQVVWSGNYFDDYRGYDFDGDGFGDVPYELRDLSATLVSRHPDLAFFRGTAALALLDLAAQAFPILQPEIVLADPRPRMTAGPQTLQEGSRAN
jgi:nitrous oxidase accessory protein